jgi:hypothetical protein
MSINELRGVLHLAMKLANDRTSTIRSFQTQSDTSMSIGPHTHYKGSSNIMPLSSSVAVKSHQSTLLLSSCRVASGYLRLRNTDAEAEPTYSKRKLLERCVIRVLGVVLVVYRGEF